MCFINYSKAFDCVNRKIFFKDLEEMEPSSLIVDLTKSLHEYNVMVVRVDGE